MLRDQGGDSQAAMSHGRGSANQGGDQGVGGCNVWEKEK